MSSFTHWSIILFSFLGFTPNLFPMVVQQPLLAITLGEGRPTPQDKLTWFLRSLVKQNKKNFIDLTSSEHSQLKKNIVEACSSPEKIIETVAPLSLKKLLTLLNIQPSLHPFDFINDASCPLCSAKWESMELIKCMDRMKISNEEKKYLINGQKIVIHSNHAICLDCFKKLRNSFPSPSQCPVCKKEPLGCYELESLRAKNFHPISLEVLLRKLFIEKSGAFLERHNETLTFSQGKKFLKAVEHRAEYMDPENPSFPSYTLKWEESGSSPWPWRTLVGHTGKINTTKIDAQQLRVVTASGDKTIQLWDLNTGKCLKMLPCPESTYTIAINTGCTHIAFAGSGANKSKLTLWDTQQNKTETVTFDGSITNIAFSPDSKYLAIVFSTDSTPKSYHICVKNLQTKKTVFSIRTNCFTEKALFTADSEHLIVQSAKIKSEKAHIKITIYSLKDRTFKRVYVRPGNYCQNIQACENNSAILITIGRCRIIGWNWQTDKIFYNQSVSREISSAAANADCSRIAVALDSLQAGEDDAMGAISIIDTKNNKVVTEIPYTRTIKWLTFLPDGDLLGVSSVGGFMNPGALTAWIFEYPLTYQKSMEQIVIEAIKFRAKKSSSPQMVIDKNSILGHFVEQLPEYIKNNLAKSTNTKIILA